MEKRVDMEKFNFQMELNLKGNGKAINQMGMEKCCTQMEIFMKEILH